MPETNEQKKTKRCCHLLILTANTFKDKLSQPLAPIKELQAPINLCSPQTHQVCPALYRLQTTHLVPRDPSWQSTCHSDRQCLSSYFLSSPMSWPITVQHRASPRRMPGVWWQCPHSERHRVGYLQPRFLACCPGWAPCEHYVGYWHDIGTLLSHRVHTVLQMCI